MIFLGEVIVNFKVMPADADVDISKVESEIKSKIKIKEIEKEPIAFGLNALKVTTVVEDSEGAADKVESELRSIDGVGEVEVTSVSRAL